MVGFGELLMNLFDPAVGFQFFLAFIFVLAVVYGVLRKIELFEDNTVDATVATVAAFFSVFGVYSWLGAQFFIEFFGLVAIAAFVILGVVVILGMMGVDMVEVMNIDEESQKFALWSSVAIVIMILVGILYYADYGFITEVITSDTLISLAMVIVIGIVVYNITKPAEE